MFWSNVAQYNVTAEKCLRICRLESLVAPLVLGFRWVSKRSAMVSRGWDTQVRGAMPASPCADFRGCRVSVPTWHVFPRKAMDMVREYEVSMQPMSIYTIRLLDGIQYVYPMLPSDLGLLDGNIDPNLLV